MMYSSLNLIDDFKRVYIKINEEKRQPDCIEDSVDAAIQGLEEYIRKNDEV